MIIRKIIASIVYSHLWIALCAASMVLQTSFLISNNWEGTPLVYLTFGGTLFIYAVHRLVGLQKLKDLNADLNPRYFIINRDQRIVLGLGICGMIGGAWYFFQLQQRTQLWLIIPGLISLAYVIPFLSGRKRLRDIGSIKIFLIALAYAIITVLLVFSEYHEEIGLSGWILFLEKAFFIFAITIPFDIRDIEVDQVSGTMTIPKRTGWQSALRLSQVVLLLCIGLIWINGIYTSIIWQTCMTFSYLVMVVYIQFTNPNRKDLFYSFGMDGLMILQVVSLYLASMTSF